MASKKILIVGPSWVGDMVMAQTLFTVLKQRNPSVIIDVLAPAWSRPLLERMPEVSTAIAMPVGHGSLQWSVRRDLAKLLAAESYDQAILMPNSLKSALIPFFAKIPLRTGWRGEMRFGLVNDIRRLDKEKYPLMVDRFVALGLAEHAPLPDIPPPRLLADKERLPSLFKQFSLHRNRPILALCPGAEFGPAKRWPEQHYAAVAEQKIAEGWQVWIFGSAKDKEVAKNIRQLLGNTEASYREHCTILAGDTQLADAIDLLSVADAVVSNDSGLMHMAAALARPLVVVYGSTSPKFTPPLSKSVRVLQKSLPCSPCFKRECPLGHLECLETLEPTLVLQALSELVDITQTTELK